MRARQRYAAVLAERSALLERDREARAQAAVAAERARIARELHAIVSHSLSVISLQAGGVRRLLASGQDKQRQALLAVERTARDAIQEMHHMPGLLRAGGDTAELNPQPGLGQLAGLVERSAAAGVTAALTIEGPERPLSSGAELAVYRVIQEALTNVTRHSDATTAAVTIRYGDRALRVSIADGGAATGAGAGAGLGLRGIRERVAAYHGTLSADPVSAGGTRSTPSCPTRWSRRDHRPARRRPGHGARRLPPHPPRPGSPSAWPLPAAGRSDCAPCSRVWRRELSPRGCTRLHHPAQIRRKQPILTFHLTPR